MLVGHVLAGVRPVRVRWAAAGLLVCLYSAGVWHNLDAWRDASQAERDFLAEIRRIEPAPPPQAEFVFHDMPTQLHGVPFLEAGLRDSIRMKFGREDLEARRESAAGPGPKIYMEWTGTPGRLIEAVPQAKPPAPPQ
jgi:hypothetical protein